MNFSLKQLAELTLSEIIGDESFVVSSVNTLDAAKPNEISFLANPRYLEELKKSNAGAFCISKNDPINENKNYLVSEDPSRTFQIIAEFILSKTQKLTGFENVHKSAVIHESAKISENVIIAPNACIDENASIGENTYIGAGSVIGPKVSIGNNCTIHPNVTIREGCIIKNNVILQPGCVIGSCGFGYTLSKQGTYEKLNQMGIVILEDDVEIGANTTIDRARFKATIIKKGTKIDNLVQIAHNVEIGSNTAIAAQTGIAGSTKVGSYVIIGGQVGITGHVIIDDQVMLATRSGVSKNLKKGKYRGSPAIDLQKYQRQYISQKNLEQSLKKIQDRLDQLEEKV
ncbi:MAG: UDP-3-O-(3-hydroxymyristoyl)glucosamine N-acyltransferase [Parachlamydiales bacterium]|nr:UDP-3-O-(3-hydroxymyristoyl)glucosamine N-acyltransferase [Parachlamydiales bacterium]